MSVSFSVSQAADACGVSRKTITRRLPLLADHGATKTDAGWVIPVEALLAVGLTPGKPTPADPGQPGPVALVSVPVAEWEAMRAKVAQADRLAVELAAVSQQATERLGHIEDLRLALRALEPAPLPEAVGETPAPSRRRWWRR